MPSSIGSARRTMLVTLIIFSSGFLLASAGTPAPDDACSLLTKEAAAALGEAATGPKATGPMSDGTGATVSTCEYTGSGVHSIHLDLTRLPANAVPMYKSMCDQQDAKGLTGMGDVACWYDEKHAELH